MRPYARGASWSADVRALAVIVACWIVPWALLWTATWVAGGDPSSAPLDFVDPRRIAARLHGQGALWRPWLLVGARRAVSAATFWPVLAAAAALILAPSVAALRRFAARTRARRPAGPPTVSRWATWWDLRRLRSVRPRAGSFGLGRAGCLRLGTEPETSVLVVGPTRSGKTSAVVIPNLFAWSGPAVVTSTKSELVDVTGAHRQAVGPVYVYDPTAEGGSARCAVTWSPVAGCDTLDRAWTVAAWLCAPLQSGTSRGDNDWAHWTESGKLLIAPLLYAAATAGLTVVDVCEWIHGFDLATPTRMLEELVPGHSEAVHGDAERALAMLTGVDQRPERERGTVFSTVMRIFSAFNERAVAESARTSRFDAADMLARRGTLYLCTPRQAPERVASLFVGILMTVVTEAYRVADARSDGRLPSPLGLFLDELANVVPVEDLPSLASQGAGRGVVLMSIVQDISQLRSRYGNDRANSIINNHGCKLVLPGLSDPDTADLISRLAGRTPVTDVQVSRGAGGSQGATYALRQEPLVTVDSLRQLRRGRALLVYRDSPPALVRLQPWFRSRRLRARARRRYFASADYAGRKL
jgi:type IV secretion system protein VirD4